MAFVLENLLERIEFNLILTTCLNEQSWVEKMCKWWTLDQHNLLQMCRCWSGAISRQVAVNAIPAEYKFEILNLIGKETKELD